MHCVFACSNPSRICTFLLSNSLRKYRAVLLLFFLHVELGAVCIRCFFLIIYWYILKTCMQKFDLKRPEYSCQKYSELNTTWSIRFFLFFVVVFIQQGLQSGYCFLQSWPVRFSHKLQGFLRVLISSENFTFWKCAVSIPFLQIHYSSGTQLKAKCL